ncbi:MAG: amino acid ABC transporter ATP-binding protein, partial [Atopobiaceae bacterium]|nr:amino acid ABC transporter ATP-binding protein [Atopobiaceae bacterium]
MEAPRWARWQALARRASRLTPRSVLRGGEAVTQGSVSEPLIRVEGLRKSFGSHLVLKDIDFAVNPGEVVTIIGASGSGKSTLLRCMNLLETPDSGHIWFHGEDLAADRVNINRLREKIG